MTYMLALVTALLTFAEPAIPLSARIVPGSPARVELTNTSNQPITAWSFAVTSSNAQGGTHRELHTADVYLSEVTRGLPRAPQHLDWIQPGQSTAVPVDAAPADAKIDIVAVIFADRSSFGDPQTVRAFFDHRRVERNQLRDVSEIMNGVLSTQRGTAAVQAIDAQLASRRDADSVPLRTAREAVSSFLATAAGTSGQEAAGDQQVRQYAAFVTKQYELAATHAEPKQH